MKTETPFKSGYITLIGRPNVGKSTLMNALLEEKLAIVTPKPQTTRQRILGILSGDNYQVILLDTPGLLDPRYALQEAMVKSVHAALQDADIILMLTESGVASEKDESVLELIKNTDKPKILAINKSDHVDKNRMLPQIEAMSKLSVFEEIIPISALKKEGLEDLLAQLLIRLPAGEPFYPPDMISDEPERFFVSELIREQIFYKFKDEIPYSTAVTIENFREQEGRKDLIEAIITVERDSQKAIVIGKGGQALKQIGRSARLQIESFLERPVFLKLVVRVRKKWRQDSKMLKQLGYTPLDRG